jgi:hypothetical protein
LKVGHEVSIAPQVLFHPQEHNGRIRAAKADELLNPFPVDLHHQ